MLGIQQTRSTTHHPTTRSAASAAAATASGPLRTKSTRRTSIAQKVQVQSPENTPSPQKSDELLDNDTLASGVEAGAGDDTKWVDTPHDERGESEEGATERIEEAEEQRDKPTLDSENTTVQQAQEGAAEGGQKDGDVNREDEDGADDSSRRASSPLSELSPAPSNTDEDDNQDQEGNGGEGEESSEQSKDAQSKDNANSVSLSTDVHATSRVHAYPNLSGSVGQQAMSGSPFSNLGGLPPSSPLPSQLLHASSTPPSSSPGKLTSENAQAGPSGTATSPSKGARTQKFGTLLELNAELFRVCQTFIASGYTLQDTPEATPFSKRLQSNLTWMSAHVDGVKLTTELPEMEPPVLATSAAHIPFPDGVLNRINKLYAQLPVLFAKDIAIRDQRHSFPTGMGTPTPGQRNSATPSILPASGIGVKRERPDSGAYSGSESPSSAKRRDTGEGKGMLGPSTPSLPNSAGPMDMRPPMTPGFPSQSQSQMQMQMQMARPGSSMSAARPMSSGGSADGMFPPSSSPGINMGGNMQGMGGMGNLSPEAQTRTREMQMRQAQAFQQQQAQQQHANQQQQHQQQQQQQHQQQHMQQQQAGMQSGNLAMNSPQRQSQATPSPTRQQQMMQAQAAHRQMSPPGSGPGMGMNNTDGMSSSQQGSMNSNMSQTGMNINGMNPNSSTPMTLNPQMVASMGPAAMATYNMLQNPQNPMVQYLNQQMPGFSQLPMIDQMRRFQMFQQQRQLQQGQRNQQMMTNQMMGGQMRPPNANASGSGTSQIQQPGQTGQMGMAPQMQQSTSEGNMQFPGTPTSANMPVRTSSGMGVSPQQMSGMSNMQNLQQNMASLNPQQRQLYLMQMQMRGGGGGVGAGAGASTTGMNPSMNPQMLAAAQERQRLEQQQRLLAQRQGSPLNPAATSGRDQFPPGLRSNPSSGIGIARTGRSPSVSGVGDMAGGATPRIGGRMLPGGDDYQRAVLLQQAQRNALMQQQQQQQGFMQGQGQGQSGWPGQQQQSQQLPLSAGAWPQQTPQGFGMGGSPPNNGIQPVDLMGTPRQTSATPAPMGQNSPTVPSSDIDSLMNW